MIRASMITSKPAIYDHFKTGQRGRTQDMKLFYRADGCSGKLFLILFLTHRAPSRPAGGQECFCFSFIERFCVWFLEASECQSPLPARPGSRNHGVPPAVVAAALVRQLRGPHLSTCP